MNDSNIWFVRVVVLIIFLLIAGIWFWRSRSNTANTPSLAASWKTFADQVQGQYSENPLQFRKQVTLQADQFQLVLETYSSADYSPADSTFTYMRGVFTPKRAFELSLQPRSTKSPIQTALSAGDVITSGNTSLDARFELRSTHAAQARALLADSGVAQALLSQPSGALIIAPKLNALNQPDGSGQWQVLFGGEESISAVQRLHALRQLVLAVLVQLQRQGAA